MATYMAFFKDQVRFKTKSQIANNFNYPLHIHYITLLYKKPSKHLQLS